jgi:EmrB/QacA subfamily drug resistance transporter
MVMTTRTRKWWTLATVGCAIFMATIDSSIVTLSLKVLQDAFHTTLGAVSWVVLAYLLAIICLVLTIGRLGDMIGKRLVYLAGLVVFTLGSALCGLAWSIGFPIGFRLLQGIGAAMLQAVGLALLIEAFPSDQRGLAMGYIGAVVAAGLSVGSALGGLLIGLVGWPAIFYLNVPLGILAITLGWWSLPDDRQWSSQRFDLVGAILLATSLPLFMLVLTIGLDWGVGAGRALALLATGILSLVLFFWWESRSVAPLIDLRLLGRQMLRMGLLSMFGAFLAYGFGLILLPFYLQSILGDDPQHAGLTLVAMTLAMALCALISGSLSDRFGNRPFMVSGLVLLALGELLVALLTIQSPTVEVVIVLIIVGIGLGLFQSPNNSTVMGAVPGSALGIAGSLLAVVRSFGQSSGVALGGAIWVLWVSVLTSRTYVPVTAAPVGVLVTAMHGTMLIAAILTALTVVPAWLSGRRAEDNTHDQTTLCEEREEASKQKNVGPHSSKPTCLLTTTTELSGIDLR